jgi:hypothetical protein
LPHNPAESRENRIAPRARWNPSCVTGWCSGTSVQSGDWWTGWVGWSSRFGTMIPASRKESCFKELWSQLVVGCCRMSDVGCYRMLYVASF